ncbi:MAG: ABC transporter ATP-binding protein/permease [Defluviitaleaceae bacterium]|nr:ABC transporter ATP-binding protein/permease [Defluviitaleaceae bacterium]
MNMLTSGILNLNVDDVLIAALVFAGLTAGAMIITAPAMYWFAINDAKAVKDLKNKLFKCFIGNSIENSMSTHSGDSIAVINTDANTAAQVYGNALSPLLSCIISITMASLVVFVIDYRLGLAAVAVGVFAFFIQYKFAKPLGNLGKEVLSANAASVKNISSFFPGAMTIRAFNIQEKAMVAFDSENNKLKILSFRQAFLSTWQNLFTTVQGWLTLCVVFAFGGWLVATEQLSFSSLMMVPAMCMAIASGMSRIGGAWANLQPPLAAAERVFSIVDNNTSSSNAINSKKGYPLENNTWDGKYTIHIDHMHFKYKSAVENTLNDVTLKIEENEMVAFVGASGSGKSTLLRAIMGMYERNDLDIKIGNTCFLSENIEAWRKKFAYVDQSCKLFNMSIEENIALGVGFDTSLDEVAEAANQAVAASFIEALPDGYKTSCGEKGGSLSGGQKQRIAIARALVRKAPILVFDEATAALDAQSEQGIMETVASLRKNHTILITTHNLNNIMSADKIVVLDKGRIAEMGTHHDLLNKKGLYAAIFSQGVVTD